MPDDVDFSAPNYQKFPNATMPPSAPYAEPVQVTVEPQVNIHNHIPNAPSSGATDQSKHLHVNSPFAGSGPFLLAAGLIGGLTDVALRNEDSIMLTAFRNIMREIQADTRTKEALPANTVPLEQARKGMEKPKAATSADTKPAAKVAAAGDSLDYKGFAENKSVTVKVPTDFLQDSNEFNKTIPRVGAEAPPGP